MIKNGIKLSFAKKKIPVIISEAEQEEFNIPIKSVSVIVDYKNLNAIKVLSRLKEQFHIKENRFKTLLYAEEHQIPQNYEGLNYSLKHIDLKAGLKTEELKKFTSESVDLLITFAEPNNTAVHLITAYCKAGIKVGRFRKNEALYNIILQAENDVELFAEELLKYLKNLKRSKDE